MKKSLKERTKSDKEQAIIRKEFAINKLITKKNCIMATKRTLSEAEVLEQYRVSFENVEKQLEIAEHISAIRKQAQDLKDQTKLLLEKANKEIEDILLNT